MEHTKKSSTIYVLLFALMCMGGIHAQTLYDVDEFHVPDGLNLSDSEYDQLVNIGTQLRTKLVADLQTQGYDVISPRKSKIQLERVGINDIRIDYDKEANRVIFGKLVKTTDDVAVHAYLYGSENGIRTSHKPLETIILNRQSYELNDPAQINSAVKEIIAGLLLDRSDEIKEEELEPPNDDDEKDNPPIAQDDKMTINLKRGDKKTTLDLSKNDENPDGGVLIYTIIVQPKRGKIVVNSTGIATYMPANIHTKIDNDRFDYKVCNEKNQCDNASVNIKIIPTEIPPKNRTGLYINPSIAIGVATNNNAILWGYETVRTPLSVDISAISGSSLNAGVEIDYYFSNILGIGAGVQYQRVSGGFDINSFNVNYFSNFHNAPEINRNYERSITMNGLMEEYTMSNIGIPLLLKFRTHPERKIGIFAHAGIQYNLISSSTSSLNTGAMASYEAIRYSSESDGFPEDGYNSATGEIDDKHTWFQTVDSYSMYGTNVEGHFDELYEDAHNLGINIPLGDGDNSADIDPHLNILGRIGLVYNMSQNIALQVGGQYTSGTLGADSSYQISDKIVGEGANKRGEYTTLLKGGPSYSTFGLTIGISLRLGGKK